MLTLTYISILAILLAILLVVVLSPLAVLLNIVDKPGKHKVHTGEVPLIGGPVIGLVVILGILVFIPDPPWSAIIVAIMLIILGVIDDRQPVPAVIKLALHFAAAAIVVLTENLAISNIGIFNEVYSSTSYSALHTIVAVIAIVASINAFNMIDGIDGLAAGQALLALLHTVIAFDLIHGGAPRDHSTYVYLLSGALSGFLMFNLQIFNGRRVFLGDSGSMLIGLMIALALIGASQETSRLQESPKIPPSLCLWILTIPITDITAIVIRRLASGRSPLSPDRTHIHHKIMDLGFSARRTLLILVLSAVGAFWFGFSLIVYVNELASLVAFIFFIPSFYYLIQKVCKFYSARLYR